MMGKNLFMRVWMEELMIYMKKFILMLILFTSLLLA